jgi:hypothetical protein
MAHPRNPILDSNLHHSRSLSRTQETRKHNQLLDLLQLAVHQALSMGNEVMTLARSM